MFSDKPGSLTILSKPGTVIAMKKKAGSLRGVSISSTSGKDKLLILLVNDSTEHLITH